MSLTWYMTTIPAIILIIIAFIFPKEFKTTIEIYFLNPIIGSRPIKDKSKFNSKYEIDKLKYELEKTRLLYTIIFLGIFLCLLVLYVNQKSIYDKTVQALYQGGVIDFINGTYVFNNINYYENNISSYYDLLER